MAGPRGARVPLWKGEVSPRLVLSAPDDRPIRKAMKRPVILLALGGDSAPFADALQRAGFDVVGPEAL